MRGSRAKRFTGFPFVRRYLNHLDDLIFSDRAIVANLPANASEIPLKQPILSPFNEEQSHLHIEGVILLILSAHSILLAEG